MPFQDSLKILPGETILEELQTIHRVIEEPQSALQSSQRIEKRHTYAKYPLWSNDSMGFTQEWVATCLSVFNDT